MNGQEQMQLLFPEENLDVMQDYMERFRKMITFYKCAMMEIETKLQILNEEFSLEMDRNPINHIRCRLKSFLSIRQKKDYIESPKPNGYRSLHLIILLPIFFASEKQYVKAEVQLLTIAMDFWASLEHQLKYKKSFAFTEEMSDEIFQCAQISRTLDEKMNRLKNDVLEH